MEKEKMGVNNITFSNDITDKSMTQQRRRGIVTLVLSDFLTAMLAWACFYFFRKIYIEHDALDKWVWDDPNFWYGILLIPTGWLLLYAIFESYKDIYRLSRLQTLVKTLFLSFFGVVFLFFSLILDDIVTNYLTYYTSFVVLFLLHFFMTSTARMVILTRASRQLKAGAVGFNTLLIGGNEKALELYEDIMHRPKAIGYRFVGYIDTNGSSTNVIEKYLQPLGKLSDLSEVLKVHQIEEVIIAIETSEHNLLKDILNTLFDYDIIIKIIPDMYDIMLGSVKMNHLYGAVLIEIQQNLMPVWQQIIKRLIDVTASFLFLVIFSPIYLYIILKVKMSSSGPILYQQERIGLNGKPFMIYKFRSMYLDAEKNGPQLASENDTRCTPWGLTMRKWRLDELPQFWNVLKGDMSLVGPRPERQYYIDLIVQRAPHYKQLLKVRPGITSWGQVKYGYASNVDEMIQRLKYDILYIENRSLALDIKIMFYTLVVLIQGKGK